MEANETGTETASLGAPRFRQKLVMTVIEARRRLKRRRLQDPSEFTAYEPFDTFMASLEDPFARAYTNSQPRSARRKNDCPPADMTTALVMKVSGLWPIWPKRPR